MSTLYPSEIEKVTAKIEEADLKLKELESEIKEIKKEKDYRNNKEYEWLKEKETSMQRQKTALQEIKAYMQREKTALQEKDAYLQREKTALQEIEASVQRALQLEKDATGFYTILPFDPISTSWTHASQFDTFPYNGKPAKLFLRSHFINEILDSVGNPISNSKNKSIYLRGPRGSGKTILLYILGVQLLKVYEDCLIYYIEDSNITAIGAAFAKIVDDAKGKRVFFLLDEVHKNPNAQFWTYLLKNSPSNVCVIGTGIEVFESSSSNFNVKLDASRMLLTSEDNNDVILYWQKQCENKLSPMMVSDITCFLLNFTGGHLFPYVKLCEYIFGKSDLYFNVECVRKFMNSEVFIKSSIYEDIFNRCFNSISDNVLASSSNLYSCKLTDDDITNFKKFGYWNADSHQLISLLFDQVLFGICKDLKRRETKYILYEYSRNDLEERAVLILNSSGSLLTFIPNKKSAIVTSELWDTLLTAFLLKYKLNKFQLENVKEVFQDSMLQLDIEKVIIGGLMDLNKSDFFDPGATVVSYENSIGTCWGTHAYSNVKNLYLRAQVQSIRDRASVKKTGTKPAFDWYLNGRLEVGLELARDCSVSDIVEKLYRRIQGAHDGFKNYFILHFVTEMQDKSFIPSSLEEQLDKVANKSKIDTSKLVNSVYTFFLQSNQLYRGTDLLCKQVCKNILSNPPLNHTTINSKSVKFSISSQKAHFSSFSGRFFPGFSYFQNSSRLVILSRFLTHFVK